MSVFSIANMFGEIIRETEVYKVIDNKALPNLTLSKTILHEGKRTSGHFHADKDEVYFFTSGIGRIKINDEVHSVQGGDVALISGGEFHQVTNTGKEDLVFLSVFENYQRPEVV